MYECDLCKQKSVKIAQHKAHMQSTHGGIQFECETCGFSALSKRGLSKHQFLLQCLPFIIQG